LQCFKDSRFTEKNGYFEQSPDPRDSFGMCLPEPDPSKVKRSNGKYSHIYSILDEYAYVIAGAKRPTNDPLQLGRFLGDPTHTLENYSLGPAAVYQSRALRQFARLGPVWVLDSAHFPYSGTMKDVRSAGILYWANVFNHRHLVLWTAGNAGMSLARAAYSYNQVVRASGLATSCVVFAETPPEIAVSLRGLKARIAPIYTREAILTRRQTRELAKAINPVPGSILDVSDGWDGIGAFLYRLVIYNALARIWETEHAHIDYLLAPAGTANLLAGAYLAAVDWGQRFESHQPKVIGVLPRHKENIKRAVKVGRTEDQDDKISDSPMAPKPPLAPKLTGVYSPLAFWVYHNSQHEADAHFTDPNIVTFLEVDQAEQIAVGARLLAERSPHCSPAAEPSALVGLAGVAPLAERLREVHRKKGREAHVPKSDKAKCLAINSGFGLLSSKERRFYHHSLLALG
jgi:hypothetical protein